MRCDAQLTPSCLCVQHHRLNLTVILFTAGKQQAEDSAKEAQQLVEDLQQVCCMELMITQAVAEHADNCSVCRYSIVFSKPLQRGAQTCTAPRGLQRFRSRGGTLPTTCCKLVQELAAAHSDSAGHTFQSKAVNAAAAAAAPGGGTGPSDTSAEHMQLELEVRIRRQHAICNTVSCAYHLRGWCAPR